MNALVIGFAVVNVCSLFVIAWHISELRLAIYEVNYKKDKLDEIHKSLEKYLDKVDAEQERIWDRLNEMAKKGRG